MALEPSAPWPDLVWPPVQRFGYRQLIYAVVIRATSAAVQGGRGGRLERRATAALAG